MSFGPIEALILVCTVAIVVVLVRRRSANKPLIIAPPSAYALDDSVDLEDPQQHSRRDRMRRTRFEQAVQGAVVQGWTIESRSDYQAVLVRGQRVNHILHLILTLITLGFWGIVWIIMVLAGGQKRQVLTVDPAGAVTTHHR